MGGPSGVELWSTGRTRKAAVGPTTIVALALNHPDAVAVRNSLIVEGLSPPEPGACRKSTELSRS